MVLLGEVVEPLRHRPWPDEVSCWEQAVKVTPASGTDVGCIGALAVYFCSWGTALYDGRSLSVTVSQILSYVISKSGAVTATGKVTVLCNNSIPLPSNPSLSSLQFLPPLFHHLYESDHSSWRK